jgi:Domain of unknown function (DUF4386)
MPRSVDNASPEADQLKERDRHQPCGQDNSSLPVDALVRPPGASWRHWAGSWTRGLEKLMHTTGNTAGNPAYFRLHSGPRGEKSTFTDRTTARIVGVLFIIGTVAGALSVLPVFPLADAPYVLRKVGEESGQALLGAFFILVMGFALALIPLVVYPILRAKSEPLALGYVVFRGGLETATYLGLVLVWLVLVSLGREYVAAPGPAATQLETIGAILLEGYDMVGHVVLTIVFALGALMFYYVLFRARLVPRWLSGWGLVAALLWVSAGVLAMFGLVEPGSTVQMAMNIPIVIQEMVLAGWLIVKGFDASAIDPVSESAGIAPVSHR